MTLVVRHEDRLLFYRKDTGEVRWVALRPGRVVETLRSDSWVTGWTHLTIYRNTAGWQCLAYDTVNGTVSFYALDEDGRATLVRKAAWTVGWTAFLPFAANGAPHYVAYKLGSGRTAIERLDANGNEETLVNTRRSALRSDVVLLEMKRHPHYFSYDRTTTR
jgi:hypothetical protein